MLIELKVGFEVVSEEEGKRKKQGLFVLWLVQIPRQFSIDLWFSTGNGTSSSPRQEEASAVY